MDDNDVDIVMTLEVPGLVRDRIFEVFIETCIEINCRQSRARTFSEFKYVVKSKMKAVRCKICMELNVIKYL